MIVNIHFEINENGKYSSHHIVSEFSVPDDVHHMDGMNFLHAEFKTQDGKSGFKIWTGEVEMSFEEKEKLEAMKLLNLVSEESKQ